MKNYAIILAAGRGTRMNRDKNKIYLPLKGKPIIVHTLEAFLSAGLIQGIILVVAPGEAEIMEEELKKRKFLSAKPIKIVTGGDKRQDSVYQGLKALPRDTEIVAIHDGARPLISPHIIDKSIRLAKEKGGAVAGMPVKDTIKEVNPEGRVEKTLDRSTLWQIQTPQTFGYSLIMKAHKRAGEDGFIATDDSALVEYIGSQVFMIEGGYDNIKMTTPEDIAMGEAILGERDREDI